MGRCEVVEIDGDRIVVKSRGMSRISLKMGKIKKAKRGGRLLDLSRERLRPGDEIDHPQLGGEDHKKVRAKGGRKQAGKIVPTAPERRRRRWERLHMKFEIEWRVKGTYDEVEVEDKTELITRTETNVTELALVPGMEDAGKQMMDVLKKAREVKKKDKKDDKKSFVPATSYVMIRHRILEHCRDEKEFPEIGLFMITECGFEKIKGVFGRNANIRAKVKQHEDDAKSKEDEKTSRLTTKQYLEMDRMEDWICEQDFVDRVINIKREKGGL